MKPIKPLYLILAVLTFVLIEVALYMAFLYAPTERTMGDVQRIFYFHVSSGWVSFLAFFVVCLASIAFLRTGKAHWDRLAACSAEIGVLFITLILLTGPLWAKPVWNVYWTWDARLTTSLILWLIYIAYLMVRNYTADPERGAKFAAVFGIIGFLDVPIVYMSIRWWRTLHPAPVMGGGGGLAPEMFRSLMTGIIAFTVLYITLLLLYYRISTLEQKIQALKHTS
jgi:heme exporter protein C